MVNLPGPCSAILLTASEDDFCTSTSDERRRWISGSSIDSVIGSVTVCVCVCVRVCVYVCVCMSVECVFVQSLNFCDFNSKQSVNSVTVFPI